MRVYRNLYLAWLALTLNALAPVFAYAHIHVDANGRITETCAADEPGDSAVQHHHWHDNDVRHRHSDDADAQDTDAQHHDSQSGKGTTPHCPYCPGFAAGAPLAYVGVGSTPPSDESASPIRPSHTVASGRSSVRIAQPRAPPSFS